MTNFGFGTLNILMLIPLNFYLGNILNAELLLVTEYYFHCIATFTEQKFSSLLPALSRVR